MNTLGITLLAALAGAPQVPDYNGDEFGATVDRLQNGLEVILLENHSVPMVACNFIVRVGSRDEEWKFWGAAHFLEHLLFNGTSTRNQDEIYAAFDRIGAYHNAHTGGHFTDFILLTPRDRFLEGLAVLSDMVFNSILPEDKFDKERKIVMEEIARQATMDSNDEAETAAMEFWFGASPLARRVLGTPEAIGRLSRQDVLEFYHRFYAPNNMVLFVTGDFRADTMQADLDSMLAGFLPRDITPRRKLPTPDFQALARLELVVRPGKVNRPNLKVAWLAPKPGEDGFIAFTGTVDALARRLSGALPPDASIEGTWVIDPDVAVYTLTLEPAETTLDAEKWLTALDEVIAELYRHPPDRKELAGFAKRYRTERMFTAERLHYFGMVNAGHWALVPWDEFAAWSRQAERLTPQMISASARQYLAAPHPAILIKPFTQSEAFAENRTHTAIRTTPEGMTVLVRSDPSARVFALHILFMNRYLWDRKYGVGAVDLLHRYLAECASAVDLEVGKRLDELAATVKLADDPSIPYDNYYTTPEFSFLRLEILPEDWKKGVEAVSMLLGTPLDNPERLSAAKAKAVAARQAAARSPAGLGLRRLWTRLAPNSPRAASVYGDPEDIPLTALSRLRSEYFALNNLIVSVASPLPSEDVINEIAAQFARRLPRVSQSVLAPFLQPVPTDLSGDTVRLGLPQGAVTAAGVLEAVPDSDLAALTLANAWLADKMGMELREKRGLAYSLGSSLEFAPSGDGIVGYWEIYLSTRPENLAVAQSGVREMLEELKNHRFSIDEVERMRSAVHRRAAMTDMSRIGQAYLMGLSYFRWNDPSYFSTFPDRLLEVTPEAVEAAVQRHLTSARLQALRVE